MLIKSKQGTPDRHAGVARLTCELQVPALQLNNERFLVPELLFSPGNVDLNQAGLPEAIVNSVHKVHPDMRPLLLSNIICCGGLFRCPGLRSRLVDDVRALVPAEYDVSCNFSHPYILPWPPATIENRYRSVRLIPTAGLLGWLSDPSVSIIVVQILQVVESWSNPSAADVGNFTQVHLFCPADPSLTAWYGGRKIGVSASYPALAISKAQYEEEGSSYMRSRKS